MDFAAEDINQAAVFENHFGRLLAAGHGQLMVHVSHGNPGTLKHPAAKQNRICKKDRFPGREAPNPNPNPLNWDFPFEFLPTTSVDLFRDSFPAPFAATLRANEPYR
jgi:hypothetical protein